MKKVNHKKIVMLLLSACLISTSIVAAFCRIYIESQGIASFTGWNVPMEYMLVIFSLVVFYFCPLLVVVGYHAQKAEMKKTYVFSRVALILYALWSIILLIEKILVHF